MLKHLDGCDNCINSSQRFQTLLTGINKPGDSGNPFKTPGDSGNPFKTPEWFNKDLFQQGRSFYRKYFFCLVFAALLGLVTGSTLKRLLLPLIFTKYSNTPRKSLRRYISTISHLITWFEEDVWDPASKGHEDIMRVIKIHHKVSNQIKKASTDVQIIYRNMENSLDFQCPFREFFQNGTVLHKRCSLDNDVELTNFFSQFDMVITQYCFVGLAITHPKKLGLHYVSQKEMESLIHFWRGIGWLLGIEDRYNLCTGSIEEVNSICLEIEYNLFKPNLTNFSTASYNNAENIMKGINLMIPAVSYPSMYLYISTMVNIPGVSSYVTWRHYSYYLLMRIVFGFVLRSNWCLQVFNDVLRYAISSYNKRVSIKFK